MMKHDHLIASVILLAVAAAMPAIALDMTAERDYPISDEKNPPPIPKPINDDLKQRRDYPMAAPTIPHDITGYTIDKNGNKCLSCHKRTRTGETQAPMVSVTHFIDRNNQFLADVSPRRYFCVQCHVERTDAKPIVKNRFVDVDKLVNPPNPR